MTKASRNPNSPTAEIPSALNRLREIAPTRGRRLAVFLDYDGTLTPIVSHPAHAVLSDSTRQAVQTLAARMPVAILSGRDLDDIRRRVDIDGIVYAGSHGFDIAGPRGMRKQVAAEFLPIADIAGVLLERKRFSISAHYRQADESGVIKVTRAVNEVTACHRELRTITGKKVYELQPDIDWNKGKAVAWLLETLGLEQPEVLPLYIGDDLTDEDAFRALEKRGVGIVVTEEMRPTAARYALKGPAEVERFLRELVACLPAGADS